MVAFASRAQDRRHRRDVTGMPDGHVRVVVSEPTDSDDSQDERGDDSTEAPADTVGSEDRESGEATEAAGAEGTEGHESEESTGADGGTDSEQQFYDALEELGRPVVNATRYAQLRDSAQSDAVGELEALTESGVAERLDTSEDPVVWYPSDWARMTDRERLVVFPERREIIADQPTQFTRAQLSQFAHLADTTGGGSYRYEIRPEDVWGAPYERLPDLLGTVRSVLPEREPILEEFIESQYERASQFTLRTQEDYVVLEAASAEMMGNVAEQHLEAEWLRAPLSDTEAWVAKEHLAAVKRRLYDAGYPVRDERELERGESLSLSVQVELRDYQRTWVSNFLERQAGVLVGPPGSGKTITALAILAAVGGETLVLVPGRELAGQWREAILAQTTLEADQVGEYHGGTKEIRPVTIATYRTAGMDRHRHLFDSREWGLIVYDEVHNMPAPINRRSADLQTRHRLGLSSSPLREDDREADIFTLVGPPIGTDWEALFESGYVAEPEVEIRYVPWRDEASRNEYASASGRERRQLAASNPAKRDAVRELVDQAGDRGVLVFVEYLDQGRALSEELGAPFVSGEMPHREREAQFERFRQGTIRTLVVSRVGDEGIDLPSAEVAIVASGLGGSRRQGTQRAGRTMRPTGRARMYVLATRGTREEEFARQRMRYLSEKGVRVTEHDEGPDRRL